MSIAFINITIKYKNLNVQNSNWSIQCNCDVQKNHYIQYNATYRLFYFFAFFSHNFIQPSRIHSDKIAFFTYCVTHAMISFFSPKNAYFVHKRKVNEIHATRLLHQKNFASISVKRTLGIFWGPLKK